MSMIRHLVDSPRSLLVPVLAAVLAACGGGDPAGPGPDPDPITPATLAVVGQGRVTDRFTAEVWVRGGFAYTSTWGTRGVNPGDTFHVWDVTADTPRAVRSVSIPGVSTTGDIQLSDDGRLLVVATERTGGSIAIYDASDPANPTLITRYTTPNTDPGVHTAEVARVNGTLYAFLSIDPGVSSPARLVIVDLSNPAAPREVFARTMGNPFVHDVFVRDGVLFTALWNDGLAIWDIGGAGRGGSPSNPVQVGVVRTAGGEVHNAYWMHDAGGKRYAFVGQEGPGQVGGSSSGDVHVVDVSDLTKPVEVAFFNVPGAGTHNFSVDEGRGVLYAAYYNGGVRAIDVRGDLGTCTAAQKSADGRCNLGLMGRELARGLTSGAYVWGVHYADGYVYASDMLAGLVKLRAVTR
jgi:hypothetical protein